MKKSSLINFSIKLFRAVLNSPYVIYFLIIYLKFHLFSGKKEFRKNRTVAFKTAGLSLDIAHFLGKRKHLIPKFQSFQNMNGLLELSPRDILQAEKSLKKDGFWVAPGVIDENLLNVFENAALEKICQIKNITFGINELESKSAEWNQDMINLDPQWVIDQPLTLALCSSPDVNYIASKYLQSETVLNYPECWFSFPVKEVDKGSAKNWHWDCDGIKWLKVFVYLNDVNLTNGPHAFVTGSHKYWKVNNKSSRVTELQILDAYGEKAINTFTAPRGTVIFEDTRGFHRGTPLTSGHRLVLQIQFNFDEFELGKSKIKLPQEFHAAFTQNSKILRFLKS